LGEGGELPERMSAICSGKRKFQGRGTYDTKPTSVGNRRGEFSIANPLHTTLDDGDGDPEGFCESCLEGHDIVIMSVGQIRGLPCFLLVKKRK